MSTFLDSSMEGALWAGEPMALKITSANCWFHGRFETVCNREAALLTKYSFLLPQVVKGSRVGKRESQYE
jgi:hypothetical protein